MVGPTKILADFFHKTQLKNDYKKKEKKKLKNCYSLYCVNTQKQEKKKKKSLGYFLPSFSLDWTKTGKIRIGDIINNLNNNYLITEINIKIAHFSKRCPNELNNF